LNRATIRNIDVVCAVEAVTGGQRATVVDVQGGNTYPIVSGIAGSQLAPVIDIHCING
jgi:hypothetical protein